MSGLRGAVTKIRQWFANLSYTPRGVNRRDHTNHAANKAETWSKTKRYRR